MRKRGISKEEADERGLGGARAILIMLAILVPIYVIGGLALWIGTR